jgi:hypothetical protein
MGIYVYPTDARWFRFLRFRSPLDEVNFWQPGGGAEFRRLQRPGPELRAGRGSYRLTGPANQHPQRTEGRKHPRPGPQRPSPPRVTRRASCHLPGLPTRASHPTVRPVFPAPGWPPASPGCRSATALPAGRSPTQP